MKLETSLPWGSGLALGMSVGLLACGAAGAAADAPRMPAPEAESPSSRAVERSNAPEPPLQKAARQRPSTESSQRASGPEVPEVPEVPGVPEDPAPMAIPKNTAVLHFGDSMVFAGFNQALSPRFRALGVRFAVRSDTGSSTVHWSPKVGQLVADTQPDLVIINLGGNEIAHRDPQALVPVVKHIVESIGGRPCVWVSPPLWREETGILEVIREHSAPCRFFDSNTLVPESIERKADGIHPNLEGGAKWAGVFWEWLMHERRGVASPWELRAARPGEHRAAAGPDGAVASRAPDGAR